MRTGVWKSDPPPSTVAGLPFWRARIRVWDDGGGTAATTRYEETQCGERGGGDAGR